MVRQKSIPRGTSTGRPSWRGQLTFGLVSFPVEAFNALDRSQSDFHFHQLHAKCHRRIRYQKMCPLHGEVSNDDIVSGYEYQKGKYVEFDPDELNALRTESERALKIESFITPGIVDPLYFDGRMYYVTPAGSTAEEPYAVLIDAMDREKRHGIGQVVFSGKDQIVLVRPLEGVLHMAMLNYEAEIRPPAPFAKELKKPSNLARQTRLAQSLIEEWSDDDFDFAKFRDPYREKVQGLIEAKLRGRRFEMPKEEEPVKVLNLMDALKKSLKSNGHAKKRRRRSA